MCIRDRIQYRRSVHAFREKEVPSEAIGQLRSYYEKTCPRLVPEIATELIVLDKDAQPALESSAGYNQFLIGAPHYLLLMSAPHSLSLIHIYIMDIAGVRVICSFEEDVFFLAKCLKDQSDIEIITEKDYISHPKPNGYRSLHLTIRLPVFFAEKEIRVPVEIQLRTIAMDFWASLEHTIRYKKNLPINTEVETELKECADSSREWDGKMEHLLHILT